MAFTLSSSVLIASSPFFRSVAPPSDSRHGRQHGRRMPRHATRCTIQFEEGLDERARWAGGDPLARFVSSVIAIEPIYNVLKFGARKLMIRTAEKSGIPWQQIVKDFSASDVYAEKELVENCGISYPDYYTKEFHGYKLGNLSWEVTYHKRVAMQAAFEVEPATIATWKRAYPNIDTPEEAESLLRGRWLQEIESHHKKFSNGLPANFILDMGCATGNSTRWLRSQFPTAQVTGLDLSPYFLAVAQYIEKKDAKSHSSEQKCIRYVHANAEDTGLPAQSFDIISCAYLVHECPRCIVANILKEAHRLLKTGGTIAFTEHSELPPAIFLLMKSTEPWIDEFHMLNLEEELERNGFTNVTSVLTDHRHFTLTATAS